MGDNRRWILHAAIVTFTVAAAVAALADTPPTSPPAGASNSSSPSSSFARGAYSGGYFDDGFVDDDWFYDYYDIQSSEASSRSDSAAVRRTDYQAEQLYEDARTSGLFDF